MMFIKSLNHKVFLFAPLFFFILGCTEKNNRYNSIRRYLNQELQVNFDIDNNTYVIFSLNQCHSCISSVIKTLEQEKGSIIIIGSPTRKQAFLLLGETIRENNKIIVDTELYMNTIPLFSDHLYVKFSIQKDELVSFQKIPPFK